jgi:hypothetical protein
VALQAVAMIGLLMFVLMAVRTVKVRHARQVPAT